MKRLVILLGLLLGVEHLAAMTDDVSMTDADEVKGAVSVVWGIPIVDDPEAMDVVGAVSDHDLVEQILAIAQSMANRATQTALLYQNTPPALVPMNRRVRGIFLRSMQSANQHNNMRSFKRLLARISSEDTKRDITELERQLRQSFFRHEQYLSVQEAITAVQAFYAQMIAGITGLL